MVRNSAGRRRVHDVPGVLAVRRHANDGRVVRENQLQTVCARSGATRTVLERVAGGTGAVVGSVSVGTQLVAMAPFGALVQVCAGAIVVLQRLATRAVAHSAVQRGSALVFAIQGYAGDVCCKEKHSDDQIERAEGRIGSLTAGSFFVGAILAISLAVAQLGLGDALWRAVRSTAGTEELVVRACDRRAVGLVALVNAVVVAVAVERRRDA